MKKEISLLVLTFLYFVNTSFSQKKKENYTYFPTKYMIIVTDSVFGMHGIKVLDSLLELKNDSAIILHSSIGDISLYENYYRLYKTGNSWKYASGNSKSKDITETPVWLKDALFFSSPKQILFSDLDNYSSSREQYIYLFIIKNKIVESIISNAEIGQISKVDPGLNADVSFFQKFDELRQQN